MMAEDRTICLKWDLENVGESETGKAVDGMLTTIRSVYGDVPVDVHVYFSEIGTMLSADQKKQLHDHPDVKVHEIPGPSATNKVDYEIMYDLLLFAEQTRRTRLIILISSDNDFFHTMKTLKNLKFNLLVVNKKEATKLKKVCKNVTLNEFKGGSREMIDDLTKIRAKHNDELREVQAINGVRDIGVFLDLDTVETGSADAVVGHATKIAKDMQGQLAEFKGFGLYNRFPKNVKIKYRGKKWENEYFVVTENTKARKWNNLINNMIAGIFKFAITYGRTCAIVVISQNEELCRAVERLDAAGFEIEIKRIQHF